MTSTPDCFAINGNTPHAHRHRFLALVGDTGATVQAALAPQPDDGDGDVNALDHGPWEDTSAERPAADEGLSAAQRLEPSVGVLLSGVRWSVLRFESSASTSVRSPDG